MYCLNRPIFRLFLLSFILKVCPVLGQTSKKIQLTPDVYDQWHTIHSEKISADSKWFAYSLLYAHEQDTTFVESVGGAHKYVFPNAHAGEFEETWFSCLQQDVLQLVQLKKRKQLTITGIFSYHITRKGQVIMQNKHDGISNLKILNDDGLETHRFTSVEQYYLNPSTTQMIFVQKLKESTSLILMDLNKGTTEVLYENLEGDIANVVWHADRKVFAFLLTTTQQQALYVLDHSRNKKFKLAIDNAVEKTVVKGGPTMNFTEDGSALLFWLQTEQVSHGESLVDVWNSLDDDMLPRRKKYGFPPRTLAKWNMETGTFKVFEDSNIQLVSPDGLFAIRIDKKDYQPSIKENSDADYYLVNLQNGAELLLLQMYDGLKTITPLPDGSGLLYFRNSDWWQYNFLNGSHQNITSGLETCFVNDVFDYANENAPISSPIFLDRSNSYLLYDTNDVWLIDVFNKKPVRLTKGRENELVYRVADSEIISSTRPFWILGTSKHIPQASEVILRIVSSDFSKYGFGFLQKNLNISNIRMFDKEIKLKSISKSPKSFLYTEERVDQAPKLMLWTMNKNKTNVLHQTNVHQRKYHWSTSIFIDYKTKDGKPVKGVLFYPANYNPKLLYPMLVYIYQQQGYSYHRYINPSFYNSDGFNTTHFTSKGYFVFRPDIVYTLSDPGVSAFDCVQSGVAVVLQDFNVDAKKIGLIGHSFGGYETNYILTQSSLFSAAVSGASITDITSKYFSLLEGNYLPGFERFELLQFRMRASLFNNRDAYRRNSPFEYVERITTPLLTWTGEKDTQVDPYQTMEFYIALRRLQKPHIMLTYPDENHVIRETNKQKDLTEKIEHWFAYWLKGAKKEEWMNKNYSLMLR